MWKPHVWKKICNPHIHTDCQSLSLWITNSQVYELRIRKFVRGNFGKIEKALDAQAICWVRNASPSWLRWEILRLLPRLSHPWNSKILPTISRKSCIIVVSSASKSTGTQLQNDQVPKVTSFSENYQRMYPWHCQSTVLCQKWTGNVKNKN